MILKLLASLVVLALTFSPVCAQNKTPLVPVPTPKTAPDPKTPDPKVVAPPGLGLELPGDQTVNYDEGFITIQANCKGDVKWLVVSQLKVKYITVAETKSIIVSIPPQSGVINVFAVGLVDGKLTDFARTSININAPTPASTLTKRPAGKYHVTFLIDMNNTTPELAKLLNSESLRKAVTDKGNWFRLYDIKSPIVTQKRLDQIAAQVGGNAVLIIQADDGTVMSRGAVPSTEAEILKLIP